MASQLIITDARMQFVASEGGSCAARRSIVNYVRNSFGSSKERLTSEVVIPLVPMGNKWH
jgi:hypothetical protein